MKIMKPAIAIGVVVTFLCSCSKSEQLKNDIAIRDITLNDSVIVDGSMAVTQFLIQYPDTVDSTVSESVAKWILNQLGANAVDDLNNGQDIVANISKSLLDSAVVELRELNEYRDGWTYLYSRQIRKLFETSKYVTFTSLSYNDTGGAHGNTYYVGQVFDKNNGKLLDWDMFDKASLSDLCRMVQDSIKTQYFEVRTDEELFDELLIGEEGFALPSDPPYFTADGVCFSYQQYEIAPYSAGMPECLISFDDIADMLVPEVRSIIN